MNPRVLQTLERAGMLRPTFRVKEALTRLAYVRPRASEARLAADGLPVPPPWHIRLVVGKVIDPDEFLETGRLAAEQIRELLAKHGAPVEQAGALLDFGCGCGRVIRYWRSFESTRVVGTDYNAELVEWCAANLPFASFTQNALRPPLPFASESFDVAYALAVFTHLGEELSRAWIDELARVLRPGGHLVISTAGRSHLGGLTDAERAQFEAAGAVFRFEQAAGTNLATAILDPEYVRTTLAREFDVLEALPDGAARTDLDLYVLRRR